MKIIPVTNNLKNCIKKLIKNDKYTTIKPIKNYSQYLKEYGIK